MNPAPALRVGRSVHVAAYGALLLFCFSATSYVIPAQEIAMATAAGAVLLSALLLGQQLTWGGRTGLCLLAYGAFVAFSVPTSIWLGPSIDGTIAVARFLVVFFATLNIVTTRRRVWGILILLVALIAIYPGLGAVRFYLTGHLKEAGRANWRGLFGNSNMTALAMLMHLPFALALYALSRKRQWKWAWAAAAALLISVTVLTKSRAGFLALLVLGVTTFAVSRRKLQVVGTAIVAGVLIFAFAPADFRERIATITASSEEQDESSRSRRIIWNTAIGIALDHPLTGIGVGTYARANAQFAPQELGKAGGQRWKDTHNTYLNIWAEIGTPGLIAFVALLVTLLTRSRRALRHVPPDDALARFVRAGVTAVWVFAVTGIFNTFQNAWFFYVLVATQLAALRILESEHAARLRASRTGDVGGIPDPAPAGRVLMEGQ